VDTTSAAAHAPTTVSMMATVALTFTVSSSKTDEKSVKTCHGVEAFIAE